jgi:hypothetical protein
VIDGELALQPLGDALLVAEVEHQRRHPQAALPRCRQAPHRAAREVWIAPSIVGMNHDAARIRLVGVDQKIELGAEALGHVGEVEPGRPVVTAEKPRGPLEDARAGREPRLRQQRLRRSRSAPRGPG